MPSPLPPPVRVPAFEPSRVRSVEPISAAASMTPAERRVLLQACGYNLFRIPSDRVAIDLLTDSGTGAMSSAQWAAMMRGDESYAGSTSYHRLLENITRLTGFTNMLPTHQGRVAERLLVETIIGQVGAGDGLIVPNNAHFDTTRHMIESSGAEARNLLCREGHDPDSEAPFKGDMDIAALERLLKERADDVPFVMLTLTCNSNGGQPVSLANMHAVRDLCDRFGKMFILDACRFAENAWFIRERHQGIKASRHQDNHRYQADVALDALMPRCLDASSSITQIVREIFDLADCVAMSTRKDGLCNVGGLLLLRDDDLHRKACRSCVLTQGFTMTYGTLPGRDLEAIAVGLQEAMDETYLAQRAGMISDLAATLESGCVKIVRPVGGHAVFIDAADFCPHIAVEAASHALACAIYEHTGIRCTRIGTVLFDQSHSRPLDLVRLAIPRRTYTQAHLEHVASSIVRLKREATRIEPRPLPHDLEPVRRASVLATI